MNKNSLIKITIRKANQDDFLSILLLIKEFAFFQKAPNKVTITFEQMKQNANLVNCFIAENEDKEIVGFASFFFAYYSWTGKALYLDDLYVIEDYRKLNIGLRLLNTVIDLAKVEKCIKVRWQVSKWNTNAIKFYKKIGAEIDETESNCDLYFK